jgi:hypothetical protein
MYPAKEGDMKMAKRRSRQYRRQPYQDDMGYAMRGMVDVTRTMAIGAVGFGMLGMGIAALKK